MVYISKTPIQGRKLLFRNTSGEYVYEGEAFQLPQATQKEQGMSIAPRTLPMSIAPKQVWTPPSPIPYLKSPIGTNIAPAVNKEVLEKQNAPVNDSLGLTNVDKTTPHYTKIKEHVARLQASGKILELTGEQSAYIQRFKAKYPDYANIPDVNLYVKNIQADPNILKKYGNIGETTLLKNIVNLPLRIAEAGGNAILESATKYEERQKELNPTGDKRVSALLGLASAGRALGTGVMGIAGEALNTFSPLINPETGVTSITEGLQRDVGTTIQNVPEQYKKPISDFISNHPEAMKLLGVGFDLSNLIPFLGALNKAKSAGEVQSILKEIKTRPATKFRGPVSQETFEAGMNRSLIKDVTKIPVKTTQATLRATGKAGEFAGETAISTGVGISKTTQKAIKETPGLYKQARTGAITRESATNEVVTSLKKRLQDLSETGKGYETIRKLNVEVPKSDLGKIFDDFLKKNDISKIDLPLKDRKVIQQAIDYVAEYGDNLTAKNALSLRRKLDDLADWSTEATGEGKRLIRLLRKDVDTYLGEKLPGLKALDAQYAPEVAFLKKVKGGILNADGTIKDNAISFVANIVGKGKEIKLDRLEKLLPGIGQKVRALRAFEEIQALSEIKTGAVTRQLGAIFIGSGAGPLGAIAGFVATNPNLVARILEAYGMAKSAIKKLLSKGRKINAEDAINVKKAVDATPKSEVESILLLGAGEQRKLLMPPKSLDEVIKGKGESNIKTSSSTVPSETRLVSNVETPGIIPPKPQQKTVGQVLQSPQSKEKSISAGKSVAPPIIQKSPQKQVLPKKETPKTPMKTKIDKTLENFNKASLDDGDIEIIEKYIQEKTGNKNLVFSGYDDSSIYFKNKGEITGFKVSQNRYDYSVKIDNGDVIAPKTPQAEGKTAIGKYNSSEILPTDNPEFSQRFIPESKIDENTTKMATIQILDKNGKVVEEFSFPRRPNSEKQIQDMADELIHDRVLRKAFNSKEFDSKLKGLKNLDVNKPKPPLHLAQREAVKTKKK